MGDVSGGAGADRVGGLVGTNPGATTNPYAMGYADGRYGVDIQLVPVSGDGDESVGGLRWVSIQEQ